MMFTKCTCNDSRILLLMGLQIVHHDEREDGNGGRCSQEQKEEHEMERMMMTEMMKMEIIIRRNGRKLKVYLISVASHHVSRTTCIKRTIYCCGDVVCCVQLLFEGEDIVTKVLITM